MLRAVPTKSGTGIQFWGGYEDLFAMYQTLMKLTGEEETMYDDREARDIIIYSFMHELRAAYSGKLDEKSSVNFQGDLEGFYGFRFSYIDLIFLIASLRYNASYAVLDSFDQENLGTLETLMKAAMMSYDEIGTNAILPFLKPGAIDAAHPLLMQFNQQLAIDFYQKKSGITRFRNIPDMLLQTVEFHPSYYAFHSRLYAMAMEAGCPINQLDSVEYQNIKW
ncbi:DUF6904 family protein [Pedobacter soli]|uniref:Uncharacterized protein n=1 Tax=Pedobacter soli TaxID=390242 RepID=A0A1G7AUX5_9SPHI|nr:hypothetical protein [Pedobacter soli]SDE18674.1 hypothetical protein SAMN04488024_11365 [Pedobacter soli]